MFLMIVVLFSALSLSLLLGIVLVNSSRRPKPFLGQDGKPLAGSISEKVFVEINGRKQGLFVKGKRLSNPLLLYVHSREQSVCTILSTASQYQFATRSLSIN